MAAAHEIGSAGWNRWIWQLCRGGIAHDMAAGMRWLEMQSLESSRGFDPRWLCEITGCQQMDANEAIRPAIKLRVMCDCEVYLLKSLKDLTRLFTEDSAYLTPCRF